MTQDPIDMLRGMYERATTGEWSAADSVNNGKVYIVPDGDMSHSIALCDRESTAALIVAMHEHLPALLAVVEAARGFRSAQCDLLKSGESPFAQLRPSYEALAAARDALFAKLSLLRPAQGEGGT